MTTAYLFSPEFLDDTKPPPSAAGHSAAPQVGEAEDDAALALALQSTDDDITHRALRTLIDTYEDRLVRFAYSIVHSIETAEDIVQEVLVRVWEVRRTLHPEQSLRAYCFTAVRRRALDVLKHRDVHARYAAEATAVSMPVTVMVDDQLEADVVADAVRTAIAQLPERRRTALRLRYEEGLPFAQIAMIMGTTEKAAKDLVTRAVRALRDRLGV